jgi:N-hydroxyarylamine O-acetyltransferase
MNKIVKQDTENPEKPDTGPDVYFQRIAYHGPAPATIETLHRLHELHTRTIPFENLNPFLGIPVKLDMASLFDKLLTNGRCGYCFEQNLLFQHILEKLGFRVRGLGARVIWNRAEEDMTSRGHMLLLVETGDEKWICDVGFGGLGPTAPLLLRTGVRQDTPHESYRLITTGEDFILQSNIRNEWKNLYRFGLEVQYLSDYEMASWYLSNNPESHFVTGLIAARPAPGLRYVMRNNEFSVHHLSGETEKRILGTTDEVRKVLEEIFLIRVPDHPLLTKKLASLLKPEEPLLTNA